METDNIEPDMTGYYRLINDFKAEYERKQRLKKDILEAARILESEDYPTNQICAKICSALQDKDIDPSKINRIIRRVLPSKYKDASKITRSKNRRSVN